MSTYSCLQYELENDVVTITLDRPEKMNALNGELLDELPAALDRAEGDKSVRAVIMTGNGEAFSAGYDLSQEGGASADNPGEPPSLEELMERYQTAPEFVHTIHNLNLPVIAAINGYALAGGSDLAMSCDIAIASERAELGYPGMRMGGYPPTATYPFSMPMRFARELLYSGKTIDAEEAERIGMVNRTVPPDDLMGEAEAEVEEIKKIGRSNVMITKHALNSVEEMQGYRPHIIQSGFLDALGHHTAEGRKFYEIRDDDGIEAALEYMNEVNK